DRRLDHRLVPHVPDAVEATQVIHGSLTLVVPVDVATNGDDAVADGKTKAIERHVTVRRKALIGALRDDLVGGLALSGKFDVELFDDRLDALHVSRRPDREIPVDDARDAPGEGHHAL